LGIALGVSPSRFRLKPFAQLGAIAKMGWQNFDGDDAVESSIAGTVNLTHSTRTNG
jgi:hypothetical protein